MVCVSGAWVQVRIRIQLAVLTKCVWRLLPLPAWFHAVAAIVSIFSLKADAKSLKVVVNVRSGEAAGMRHVLRPIPRRYEVGNDGVIRNDFETALTYRCEILLLLPSHGFVVRRHQHVGRNINGLEFGWADLGKLRKCAARTPVSCCPAHGEAFRTS